MMKKSSKKLKQLFNKFWGWIKPYLTPKMIPIVLFIWCMTNGAWYVIAFVHFGQPIWLMTFAKGYLIFLWSPIAIEKPIILIVSGFIYRFIYKEKFIKKEKSDIIRVKYGEVKENV